MEKKMTKIEMAKFIDQTLLSPVATKSDVEKFCTEAKSAFFKSVCINPRFVKTASEILSGSQTKVCTVIDFPLGAGGIESKMHQADVAISDGADELDFVADISLIKAREFSELTEQLRFLNKSVTEAAIFSAENGMPKGHIVTKLILETVFLSDEEIVESCRCAKNAGFDFVKTSTGFAMQQPNGATVHAVELMRKTVGDSMGVKASGGIRSAQDALKFISAGASRIGTSSGIKILSEIESVQVADSSDSA
jgi:deoxyribose-phosphate aldolase